CRDGDKAVVGFFQTTAGVSEGPDILRIPGLDPNTGYQVSTRPQKLYIRRFGGMVKHWLPLTLNPQGFIWRIVSRHYALTDCVETYRCRGDALAAGILLNNQFIGTNYNARIRLLGDFGSNLYMVDSGSTNYR
ncbi:MAG: GH36 C-terminal domain-containing protein, partial [Treponema sp.]|nr:GH36 C-terminal domain-containing protein [Treponema sp.]